MKYIIAFLIFTSASAQRFDVISGKLEALRGISEYNVVFDYKGMEIEHYKSEEAYLATKAEQMKEHPDKAKAFAENWFADREGKYEPRFIDYFNSRFDKSEVKLSRNPGLKYTMHVKSTWLYPGYGMGPSGKPSKVSAIITISETENPANVLVSIAFDKVIGMENRDPNKFGERISGAYEKLAKNFVMQLKRVL